MRGVWVEKVGAPWAVREVPDPQVRPGGVVVDVVAVRVPSYTRQVLDGELGYDLPTPLVPGPTCVGRVRAVGEDVFAHRPGDVVLCNSLHSSGDAVGSPDEILIGWTGTGSARSARMQQVWRHGSFAERACYPASCLTTLPGGAEWSRPELLPFLASLAIADGGLRRGGLRGGQTVLVNGATGNLGGAGTLAALARGAVRVIVTGRRADALAALAALDPRVRPVPLSGDRASDTAAILEETDDGADLLLDVIAHTPTTDPTLACVDALRLRGTAVLVGGVRHDLALPYQRIQRRQLTVAGSFMFDSATALEVWQLVRSGAIDLDPVRAHVFDLDRFEAALDRAASLTGLEYAVLEP
ncbi:zinc-binding dehydrogenase [Pseudonocardia adelaidensis]|uniref:zinc-binding dehydrogenase n=1 Tax=Pseudonocardia adelaidensis TaxID=648754 RepID=UPI0031EDF90C